MLYNYAMAQSLTDIPRIYFPASLDALTRFISACVCVLMLCIAIATHNVFVIGLFVAVIALSYAYSPKGYAISEEDVVVQRLVGRVRIPLQAILEIRRAESDDLKGCMRFFGNGGLFGYYGLYRTSKLGKCSWYVTDRGKGVILFTGTKTMVFSPDDAAGFISALRAAASLPDTRMIRSVSDSKQANRRS